MAVRTSSPIGTGTGAVRFVETAGLELSPTPGLSGIKSTMTALVLRASPGLGGKPPRPVTINSLLATVLPA